MAEVTILAQQSGITREAFLACLFEPTFTSKLLRKDFGLGLTAARERQVPMPVSATVHELIQGLVGRGYGDVDFAAFIQQEAESAGITLESEHAEVSDGLDSDDS
jgi:3-hydroxyisobutyrate dehydrogenase